MKRAQKPANGSTPTRVPGSPESRPDSPRSTGKRHAGRMVGQSMCQCSACKRYFTTTANFDRHRAWVGSKRTCRNPAECGLVLRDTGHWGAPPMTEQQKADRGWA